MGLHACSCCIAEDLGIFRLFVFANVVWPERPSDTSQNFSVKLLQGWDGWTASKLIGNSDSSGLIGTSTFRAGPVLQQSFFSITPATVPKQYAFGTKPGVAPRALFFLLLECSPHWSSCSCEMRLFAFFWPLLRVLGSIFNGSSDRAPPAFTGHLALWTQS